MKLEANPVPKSDDLIQCSENSGKPRVNGAENPRCRSQNPNLTNEPHSVLSRTFIYAIGHQKRINIDEDSISVFFAGKKNREWNKLNLLL